MAIGFMTWLGRVFKLRPKLMSLPEAGSAICGAAAIIAARGAIDAVDDDSSNAIAAILALAKLARAAFTLALVVGTERLVTL